MKKKLTAFALALSLILACAACTSQQTQQSAQPSSSPSGSSAPDTSESTTPATVSWPDGNVEIYLPINGGTVTDAAGRAHVDGLVRATNGTFAVQNEATGGGTVMLETIRNAQPDGLTLGIIGSSGLIAKATGMYDYAITDQDQFTIISYSVGNNHPNFIFCRPDCPYDTVDELVAYCKEHPGEVKFSNSSNTLSEVYVRSFVNYFDLDVQLVEVASSDVITSFLGGFVDVCFNSYGNVRNYDSVTGTGEMKVLAAISEERDPEADMYPCYGELGLSEICFRSANVLIGPAGMDPELVKTINALSNQFNDYDDLKERITEIGAYDVGTPEECYETMVKANELIQQILSK